MEETYFAGLVYSLANEDSAVEYDLLPPQAGSVFCVAGSGARVLPLLAKNPKKLLIVDVSRAQLFLTELRIQAARIFSRDEFLFFMGYPEVKGLSSTMSRWELFQRLQLSPDCRSYWQEGKEQWQNLGFIYLGRWEKHFLKVAHILRDYVKIHLEPIFAAETLEEQRKLYLKHFPFFRWGIFIRLAASRFVFNRILYRGRFSGSQADAQLAEAPWQFIDRQFKLQFETKLLRHNYFLQSLLLGRLVYDEGLPAEAQAQVLAGVQAATTEIRYVVGNLVKEVNTKGQACEFYSLSDTLSYLSASDVETLASSQEIPTGAQIVFRSFLRVPPGVGALPWRREPDKERQALAQDCTGVYKFFIYQK